MLGRTLFWASLGALAWTHGGYPLCAAALARAREQPVRRREITPTVSFIVAAHDEERVIGRLLENLLALDYPTEKLEIVIASDASTDRTDEIVGSIAERDPRIRLLVLPRGGKVAAQNEAVRASRGEVLAFSDANVQWRRDALRMLVRSLADPEVGYVCGHHVYEAPGGTNREPVYSRYEAWVRRNESRLGSITAGLPIYAVRRADYIELDPRFGHDLALPYLMVQRGRRAVVDLDARAWEKPATDIEDEYRRKVRMFEHCWLILHRGGMLRGLGPWYLLQIVSHRHLRYGSGVLHLVLLGSSLASIGRGRLYRSALAAQLSLLLAAAVRSGIARYYVLVTWATVPALVNYLRAGVSPVWEKAEGTR